MKVGVVLALLVVMTGMGWAGSFDEGKVAFGNRDWPLAATLFGRFLQESPDDGQAPSAAFLRGVALYQTGDFRGSLDAFQKLDRTWPLSAFAPKLPYWKGTAALAAGQWSLAERELAAQSRFPEQEPFTTRALLNLALARESLGKDDLAVEPLAAFTKNSHDPTLLAQAWVIWGDLDRKAGRSDQALVHYKAAWTTEPGGTWDLSARTQSVDILLMLKRWTEAKTMLESSAAKFPLEIYRWDSRRVLVARAIGDLTGAKSALESLWAREADPTKKQEFAVNRARLSEESGKPEAEWWLRASTGPDPVLGNSAVLRYAFLVESDSQWITAAEALENWAKSQPSPESGELARSRAAEDRRQAGDFTGASKVWSRLISDFPRSPLISGWLLARGRIFLESNQSASALVDFTRLLKERPGAVEASEARYQTGLVYLQRQEPARAEAWFYSLVQDLKTGDLYQRALLARGVCFVNSGQTELARGSLQRLIREAPDGPWASGAWAALGHNAAQARLYDEAVDAYTHAMSAQTDPKEKAAALWSLAETLTSKGSVAEASKAFGQFSSDFKTFPKAEEARYRQGSVYLAAKDWRKALDNWSPLVSEMSGEVWSETKEGMAVALLQLGQPAEGWTQLETAEAKFPVPDAWYRWGELALSLGQTDWAMKAFQFLLQKHPDSRAAEAALPRAAGALLTGGKPEEAVARYADYFIKFGKEPASAPVARAAAAAAQKFPLTLELLVTGSRGWNLAPEVSVEFAMAWAQSRLDSDTDKARIELQDLSRTAPWTSQRSEALAILGRWHLGRGNLAEARSALEAASGLGDDLSIFKARWALAQVTEKEGDLANATRQRESAEKAAGPGVPVEFRIQILKEAALSWTKAGRSDDVQRVTARIQALSN